MNNSSHTKSFSRHPMLLLACTFACGIALSEWNVVDIYGSALMTAAGILLCIVIRNAPLILLPLLFIPLGTLCREFEKQSIASDRIKRIYSESIRSYEPVEIEGVMLGYPEPAYGGSFMTIRVEKLAFAGAEQPASGRVRLFVVEYRDEEVGGTLKHGSIVRVACRLEREERFLNPGVQSRAKVLDQQGIDAVATVKSPLLIEKLGDDSVFLPLAWAYKQRRDLVAAFRDLFSARTAGVMSASLLGDKHYLDRETAEVFREGGTFHVLVISGLHITVIGGLTLWLVSFFTRRVLWQSILAGTFLWAYTFAVGAEIPVVRASIMFTLLLISRLIYRPGSLLNALGTCTLLLLVWRPSDLFSASFQLTFVSVAAIVGSAFPLIEKLRAVGSWTPSRETPLPPVAPLPLRRFCELLYWNEAEWRIGSRRQIWSAGLFKSPYLGWLTAPNLKSILAYVVEGLLVSVIVQIWMLPLVAIYFHRVSPAGLVLNLWVGVLLALESFAAIAAVIAAGISMWLAAPLVGLTELLNTLMIAVPTTVSGLHAADFRVAVYSGELQIVYFCYAAAVVIAAIRIFGWDPFALRHRRPTLTGGSPITFCLLVTFGTLIIFHPFSSPAADGKLRVDFLDVGQGDSALVTFPDGQTMLIDGGGRVDYRADDGRDFEPDMPRIGESVVSEFLWEKGYSRVDYILGTHADADHMQGLVDVARNFDVGIILLGDADANDADLAHLLAVADQEHIAVQTIGRGDNMRIAGVEVGILNPSVTEFSLTRSTNDRSVVLHIKFGSHAFLLTGDIEREAELEITNRVGNLTADIVKVPHHGSRTSSAETFVHAVDARKAVISVGRRSRFGHPHKEVVARWGQVGADVMTTGERGTITVETDGDRLDIRTFRP